MNRRQADILELLQTQGEVSVADLARRFQVTSMTIRRDLDELGAEGCLVRTHGGALPARVAEVRFAFAGRADPYAARKQAIASEAARLVQPGMIVTLDTGTTTLAVAQALAETPDLTVITSSLAIAAALYPHANIHLILLGGAVRQGTPDLSGELTEQNLGRYRSSLAFLGADAAAADGLYTSHEGVSRVSRAMMSGAARKILVLDSGKFQSRALARYAVWEDFDLVITDDGVPAEVSVWLDQVRPQVTCASVSATRSESQRLVVGEGR